MPSPNLYVLISTIGRGIQRVPQVLLPPQDGVRYVVSWQQGKGDDGVEYPAHLKEREDVVLSVMEGKGLCRNRNNAMKVATSWFADPMEDAVFVIADDDERLEPDGLEKVRQVYGAHPKVDVVLWQMCSIADGQRLKDYPLTLTDYDKAPRSYYVSSVEMTFRSRNYFMGLRFDERFGLGSEKLCAGEEDVFLRDAQQLGLHIWLFPRVLCRTEATTTGSHVLEPKVLRSKGAVYAYRRSWIWTFCRSWREAFSLAWRHHVAVIPLFRNIWSGVKYIRS